MAETVPFTPKLNHVYGGWDARQFLAHLPAQSINTIVTSPPYFGLRDYGVDGQIGLEPTPEAYVAALVSVFREAKRALRDDGTLWINIGDSYAGSGARSSNPGGLTPKQTTNRGSYRGGLEQDRSGKRPTSFGLPNLHDVQSLKFEDDVAPKNLLGIPWRLAFALQADGWILRSDIIWNKPNQMPESVTDRPTKAHEYIFLLAKSGRYYYDADAIREPMAESTKDRYQTGWNGDTERGDANGKQNNLDKWAGSSEAIESVSRWRNRRSVWTVTTKPFKGAHFATFPPDLIEPCILAGSPKGGVVCDPFMGSGTTAVVAQKNGRDWYGCELNPEYAEMANYRIQGRFDEYQARQRGDAHTPSMFSEVQP